MNDDYDYQAMYHWDREELGNLHFHGVMTPIRSRKGVRMERQMRELLLSANEYKQRLDQLQKQMLAAATQVSAYAQGGDTIKVALYTNPSA